MPKKLTLITAVFVTAALSTNISIASSQWSSALRKVVQTFGTKGMRIGGSLSRSSGNVPANQKRSFRASHVTRPQVKHQVPRIDSTFQVSVPRPRKAATKTVTTPKTPRISRRLAQAQQKYEERNLPSQYESKYRHEQDTVKADIVRPTEQRTQVPARPRALFSGQTTRTSQNSGNASKESKYGSEYKDRKEYQESIQRPFSQGQTYPLVPVKPQVPLLGQYYQRQAAIQLQPNPRALMPRRAHPDMHALAPHLMLQQQYQDFLMPLQQATQGLALITKKDNLCIPFEYTQGRRTKNRYSKWLSWLPWIIGGAVLANSLSDGQDNSMAFDEEASLILRQFSEATGEIFAGNSKDVASLMSALGYLLKEAGRKGLALVLLDKALLPAAAQENMLDNALMAHNGNQLVPAKTNIILGQELSNGLVPALVDVGRQGSSGVHCFLPGTGEEDTVEHYNFEPNSSLMGDPAINALPEPSNNVSGDSGINASLVDDLNKPYSTAAQKSIKKYGKLILGALAAKEQLSKEWAGRSKNLKTIFDSYNNLHGMNAQYNSQNEFFNGCYTRTTDSVKSLVELLQSLNT